MTLQPGQMQHQLLRSTCDACTAAKVKCSQTRPLCARCARQNIPCVYGVSRKATRNGATSRKNRLTRTKAMEDASTASAPSTASPVTFQPPVSDVMDDFVSMTDAFQFPLGFSMSLAGSHPTFNFGQATTSPPQSDSSIRRTSPSVPGNGGNMPFGLFAPNTPSLSAPDFADMQGIEGLADPPAETAPADAGPDNCCSESVDIMVVLQFKAIQGMKTSPTGEQGPHRPVSLPFDHILATCHSACKRLMVLMQCSCAAKEHMAVMHSAIISAILYWFGCAADSEEQRRRISDNRPERSNHSSSSQHLGHSSPCSSSAPKVTGARATLGLYQLEEEDQVAIQQALILGKVRLVSTAIDRLAEVGASAGRGPRNHSIHRVLAAWLRSEIQKVRNTFQAGADAAGISDW